MSQARVGQRIGRYRLMRQLGKGGMGAVFLARAEGPGGFEKYVALKVAHAHLSVDKPAMEMFLAEARVSARLNHANIAQIYDLGLAEDDYFIAMEFVPGRDLRRVMEAAAVQQARLPLEVACYVLSKLCEGLDFAHRQRDNDGRPMKLVHRDVSPVNTLLSFSGEVKLIDFGIAKAATESARTQPGMVRGKIGYMSPEQVMGKPLDRRSDVFAVGIMLYELLVGARPFDADTDVSTMRRIRDGVYDVPSSVDPELPAELDEMVRRCLQTDPERRYQWASELQQDLQQFLFRRGTYIAGREVTELLEALFGADVIAQETRSPDAPEATKETGQLPELRRSDTLEGTAEQSATTTNRAMRRKATVTFRGPVPAAPAERSRRDSTRSQRAPARVPTEDTVSTSNAERSPPTLPAEPSTIGDQKAPSRQELNRIVARPNRSYLPWAAGAALAVLLLTAAALWRIRGAERANDVPPAPPPSSAEPDPAEPAPDSWQTARVDPVEHGAPDAGAAREEVAPATPRKKLSNALDPSRRHRPQAAAPNSGGGTAYIDVVSNKPAAVFVDDIRVGDAPLKRQAVAAGKRRVRVDCIYSWGTFTGQVKTLELAPDAEALVKHECRDITDQPK